MRSRVPLATLALLVPLTCSGRDPGAPVAATTAKAADPALAARLVEAARSADPVLCDLAARALDAGWWNGGTRPAVGVSEDPAVVEVVEWSIEAPEDSEAIDVLSAALSDADSCVRRLSARILGRMDSAAAVAALQRSLGSPSPASREAAALGLGVAESETAVPALVAALDDAEPRVRAAAAWALGRVENPTAIEPLVEVLANDAEATVREAAAWALGAIE